LGDNLSARSVAFESPVLIRSRFIENASTISFLLPCIQGDVALLNGKEVNTRYLASSNGGVKYQLLTKGTHEVGAFTVDREVRTLEAIIKERTGLSALSYLRRRRLTARAQNKHPRHFLSLPTAWSGVEVRRRSMSKARRVYSAA
jgi:hypothetical protein